MVRRRVVILALAAGVVGLLVLSAASARAELSPMEQLGRALFFDAGLSTSPGQSCAACHAPEVGFTGPDAQVNVGGAVYPGALPNHHGNRKPPASAYAGDSPVLYYDDAEGGWFGGMF